MPRYCYVDVYGKTYEFMYPMGEAPEAAYLPTGRIVRVRSLEWRRSVVREFRGSSRGWPIESFSLGVNPVDRFKAMKDAADHKVPTEYNERGNPILRDPDHARRFRKYLGAHDRDGFFD